MVEVDERRPVNTGTPSTWDEAVPKAALVELVGAGVEGRGAGEGASLLSTKSRRVLSSQCNIPVAGEDVGSEFSPVSCDGLILKAEKVRNQRRSQ